jgi:anti-anti-sigma regulatory factor
MEMNVETIQGNTPVTILSLQGDLDASNSEAVIAKVQGLFASGTRRLLLDLSGLQFMSSSGLVALHSINLLMRGEQPHDLESGWDAFHAIDQDRERGLKPQVKVLNPRPKIASTLQKTGMDRFFEIFTDRKAALESYQNG